MRRLLREDLESCLARRCRKAETWPLGAACGGPQLPEVLMGWREAESFLRWLENRRKEEKLETEYVSIIL